MKYLRVVLTGWLFVLGFAQTVLSQPIVKHQSGKQNKPNIVFILADDMGYGDPQCYNAKSRISTPFMNRMSEEGMLFTNAHSSSSVCTPSRYSILTGRYAWRSKLKRGVLWSYDWPLIEEDRLTIADYLKSNSYNTSLIGKWHLGWNWPVKDGANIDSLQFGGRSAKQTLARERMLDFSRPLQGGPLACGFDYQFGIDIPSLPPFVFIENGILTGKRDTALSHTMNGYAQQGWKHENMMPAVLEKSLAYIGEHANKQEPFFMFLSLTAPHTPIYPNVQFRGRSQAGDYGDFVSEVDDFLGQIMRKLRSQGIDENTIVFFTSDNGGISAAGDRKLRGSKWGAFGSLIQLFDHNSSNGWRGMKGDIWEGGHRIPLLVRWPGVISPHTRCDSLVSLTDIFATCVDILGKPVSPGAAPDSYSFLDLLKQMPDSRTRAFLVAQSSYGNLSITRGNMKYINCNHSGGNLKDAFIKRVDTVNTPGQLYNLLKDPGEQHNLYSEQPDQVKELSDLLDNIVRHETEGRPEPVQDTR